MANGHTDLNSIIDARAFFERILKERDKFDDERQDRLDERFASQEKAIGKAEQRLDTTLQGFPDEYSRKVEVERLRENLASTAATLAEKVSESARVLKDASDREGDRVDTRIKVLENFQSKLLGIALVAPIVTGVATFLITRSI